VAKDSSKLMVSKPKNVFIKPLQFDYKGLFLSLSKGVGHTVCGKWEELASDSAEALSAIGLSTEPGELSFLLIKRSIIAALFELVGESANLVLSETKKEAAAVIAELDFTMITEDVRIDKKFFDRPTELPILHDVIKLLQQWLEAYGFSPSSAKSIADRFPGYFAYALNIEWRRNAKAYRPIIDAIETPFTKANERESAWSTYSALLQKRIQESVFDESFSLAQIFIPLNAYYLDDKKSEELTGEEAKPKSEPKRVVVPLLDELEEWLKKTRQVDAIRILSGGPGSGKSSFARIFAAKVSQETKTKILFVQLHLIDPMKDLVDEVGRFVRDEGILIQNPLDPESPEPDLLIIFDGLDELSSQGKAAAEAARSFIREVEKTVEKRNMQRVRLRVLISGRELVVQENESEFRHPKQILTLLPYLIEKNDEYSDPHGIVKNDLRQKWWKNYGELVGKKFTGLPQELSREDLDEITAQPLLNYLVALTYLRGKLDFQKDINLNSIYYDLVAAVHERGYENRQHASIRHMEFSDFLRVLEEIGLASWHGDGRTTSVKEIEEHCRISRVDRLLEVFREGAEKGITRLLAAFFFRRYGERSSGDHTFVFTHKSFGEYLTARRIVRAVGKIVREIDNHDKSPDEGWDENEALKHWAQICGPTAISHYLHSFIVNEIALSPKGVISQWQIQLSHLFSYMLRNGMPIELLQLRTFKDALHDSRNAEEALLVALNACARVTGQVSEFKFSDPTIFGTWFKRIQGQRTGPESVLATRCLSYLRLDLLTFYIGDFYNTNFSFSNLNAIEAFYANFISANFKMANLSRANLNRTDLEDANLEDANLENANLQNANLQNANLQRANLKVANLTKANLEGANLKEADLRWANLTDTKIRGAIFEGAIRTDTEEPALEEITPE
jgi:hypothetical protein